MLGSKEIPRQSGKGSLVKALGPNFFPISGKSCGHGFSGYSGAFKGGVLDDFDGGFGLSQDQSRLVILGRPLFCLIVLKGDQWNII